MKKNKTFSLNYRFISRFYPLFVVLISLLCSVYFSWDIFSLFFSVITFLFCFLAFCTNKLTLDKDSLIIYTNWLLKPTIVNYSDIETIQNKNNDLVLLCKNCKKFYVFGLRRKDRFSFLNIIKEKRVPIECSFNDMPIWRKVIIESLNQVQFYMLWFVLIAIGLVLFFNHAEKNAVYTFAYEFGASGKENSNFRFYVNEKRYNKKFKNGTKLIRTYKGFSAFTYAVPGKFNFPDTLLAPASGWKTIPQQYVLKE